MANTGIGIKFVGDWAQAEKILAAAPADLKQACQRALKQEALYLLSELQKNFKKVTPPNAASTIANKGSSRPLVNHRDLYNAMAVVQVSDDEVFIGISGSTKSRGKTAKGSLTRLVDIHEHGKIIIQHMTDKQRRFLHARKGGKSGAKGAGGGGGIIIIHIPARPFIKPTFDQNTPDQIAARYLSRVTSNLKVIPKP